MSNFTPSSAPAGWYPAPGDDARMRWWDGARWTEDHVDRYTTAATLRAPEGTKVYTVWIWLITFMPLVSLIPVLSINFSSLFAVRSTESSQLLSNQLGLYTSPGYLFGTVLGWLVYGLSIWFAYLDWKWLKAADVPRPFHFGWTALSGVVYTIGRSVVVRRRAGYGIAPMWVAIVVTVLLYVVIFGVVIAGFTTGIQNMQFPATSS